MYRLILIACAALLTHPAAGQVSVSQILENGPTSSRINVVYLAEGYTANESDQFFDDASGVLSFMLSQQPYQRYMRYFNAFAVFVPSAESGSDHPSQGIYRDTYFNSTYDSFGIQYLVTIPPNNFDPEYANGLGRVFSVLQEHMPEFDIVILLVNDPAYGGSGGPVSITSMHPAAPDIAVHEVGHTFALLTDEYETPFPGWIPSEYPNATSHVTVAQIPWRDWIASSTPIPTPPTSPYHSVVGLFEGAQYHSTGWYRPKFNCKMRQLGVPFCEVCREEHVHTIYQLVDLIEQHQPAELQVSHDGQAPISFSVSVPDPKLETLAVRWFVDGTEVPAGGAHAVELGADWLGAGTVNVTALVADESEFVQNDAILPLLTSSITWTVTSPVGIAEGPAVPHFHGHFPNPTIGEVTFGFTLAQGERVDLRVFDLLGREVAMVMHDHLPPGLHEVGWSVAALSAGHYVYRLQAGHHTWRRSLVVAGR